MSERSDNICVYDRSENDSVLLTGKKENDGNESERKRGDCVRMDGESCIAS